MSYKPNKAERQLIAALRSGKYTQGKQSLRTRTEFCCLGVACDISQLGRWEHGYYLTGDGADNLGLPQRVREWLGWAAQFGDLIQPHEHASLALMNDTNHTFEEIADAIEAGLVRRSTD